MSSPLTLAAAIIAPEKATMSKRAMRQVVSVAETVQGKKYATQLQLECGHYMVESVAYEQFMQRALFVSKVRRCCKQCAVQS